MFKKAQAAMEFLMTYGWAILVVLIVLAALFYLGIFSPRTPSICVVSAPITCPDVKADSTTSRVTLVLGATSTQTATLDGVSLSIPTPSNCPLVAGSTISKAAPTSIDCTPTATLTAGQKYSGNGTISYTLETGGIPHRIQVQFSGIVE